MSARAAPSSKGFRVVSPQDGDRYAIPAGIDARYSTIALRAAGGAPVKEWTVDGVPYTRSRWSLVPGDHLFRAVSARGEVAEARVVVVR
jgi:Penicillin-Binding Protein C-terminus Family.